MRNNGRLMPKAISDTEDTETQRPRSEFNSILLCALCVSVSSVLKATPRTVTATPTAARFFANAGPGHGPGLLSRNKIHFNHRGHRGHREETKGKKTEFPLCPLCPLGFNKDR